MPIEHRKIPQPFQPSLEKGSCFFVLALLVMLILGGCAGRLPVKPDTTPPLLYDPDFVQNIKFMGRIAVVAPSFGLTEEGEQILRSVAAKLDAHIPAQSFLRGVVPYSANDDDARLSALVDALTDPTVKVVWAARGGYGASRLLEGLTRVSGNLSPKIVIGYSDITFLHLFLQKIGWQTVHGAMLVELSNNTKEARNFRLLAELLAGKMPVLEYDGFKPRNAAAQALAVPVNGVVTGGNLTCIAAAVGTPWALDAAGKILFLEDVEEPGYKVDRMLTQLKAAGQLDGVKAIIFGEFSDGDEFTAYALERFAKDCAIPIFVTNLFGHGSTNLPLLFNAPATLEKKSPDSDSARLTIQADAFAKTRSAL